MFKKAIGALLVAVCLAAPGAVQAQQNTVGKYLDITIVKVKPGKTDQFIELGKKIADANRRFHGDQWLALETVYGRSGVYMFVSPRQDYAALDTASKAFMGALDKAYGKPGAQRLFSELNDCVESARSELRLRRPDLSSKTPSDAAAMYELVGESRFERITTVRVRFGHEPDFEAMARQVKDAAEKNAAGHPSAISQALEGSRLATFYISSFRKSFGDFDNNPTLPDLLGEAGFKKFLQASAETVENVQTAIYRIVPELSNPADAIAAAAPEFWHPKPAAAPQLKAPAAKKSKP